VWLGVEGGRVMWGADGAAAGGEGWGGCGLAHLSFIMLMHPTIVFH
jgi:hypothetical protein